MPKGPGNSSGLTGSIADRARTLAAAGLLGASKIESLSKGSGISVQTLSGIEPTIKKANVSLDEFVALILELQAKLGGAGKESEDLREVLKKIGFAGEDISRSLTDAEHLVQKLIEGFGKLQDIGSQRDILGQMLGYGGKQYTEAFSELGKQGYEGVRKEGLREDAIEFWDILYDTLVVEGIHKFKQLMALITEAILEQSSEEIVQSYKKLGRKDLIEETVAEGLGTSTETLQRDVTKKQIFEILRDPETPRRLVPFLREYFILKKDIPRFQRGQLEDEATHGFAEAEGSSRELALAMGEMDGKIVQATQALENFRRELAQGGTGGADPEGYDQVRLASARGRQTADDAMGGWAMMSEGIQKARSDIMQNAGSMSSFLKMVLQDTADAAKKDTLEIGNSFLKMSQTIHQGLLQLQQAGAIKGKGANKGLGIAGAVLNLISGGLGLFGQIGKLFPTGGGAAAAWSAVLPDASGGILAARGGVLPGHFAPIRTLQEGGIINKPTFGLVGEGELPEAVVPLPDRRNIPVRLMGEERQRPIQITIVNDYKNALDPRGLKTTPEEIKTVFIHGMKNDTVIRRAVREEVARK